MGWLKLDDQRLLHPKLLAAGPFAELLDDRAMLFCAQRETDGHLSTAAFRVISTGIPAAKKHAARLVEADRWHTAGHDCQQCPPVEEAWYVHGYLDFNPSRADREAEREAARERMRKARDRGPGSAERAADVQANVRKNNGRSSGNPVPVPRVPTEHNGRARRDAEKPNPKPPDYEPPAAIESVAPSPEAREAILRALKGAPPDEATG